jgi:hypothetical protein
VLPASSVPIVSVPQPYDVSEPENGEKHCCGIFFFHGSRGALTKVDACWPCLWVQRMGGMLEGTMMGSWKV